LRGALRSGDDKSGRLRVAFGAAGARNGSAVRAARGRGIPRSDGLEVKRIVAYVPVGLWRAFGLRCVVEERSMSEVVTETVAAWVKKKR
jgi:hypothetical protein